MVVEGGDDEEEREDTEKTQKEGVTRRIHIRNDKEKERQSEGEKIKHSMGSSPDPPPRETDGGGRGEMIKRRREDTEKTQKEGVTRGRQIRNNKEKERQSE